MCWCLRVREGAEVTEGAPGGHGATRRRSSSIARCTATGVSSGGASIGNQRASSMRSAGLGSPARTLQRYTSVTIAIPRKVSSHAHRRSPTSTSTSISRRHSRRSADSMRSVALRKLPGRSQPLPSDCLPSSISVVGPPPRAISASTQGLRLCQRTNAQLRQVGWRRPASPAGRSSSLPAHRGQKRSSGSFVVLLMLASERLVRVSRVSQRFPVMLLPVPRDHPTQRDRRRSTLVPTGAPALRARRNHRGRVGRSWAHDTPVVANQGYTRGQPLVAPTRATIGHLCCPSQGFQGLLDRQKDNGLL